jgi:hypothetical protein
VSADSTPSPLHLSPLQKYVSIPLYILTVFGAPQAHQQQRRSILAVYSINKDIFFRIFLIFYFDHQDSDTLYNLDSLLIQMNPLYHNQGLNSHNIEMMFAP